jgi:hypothetical protein
MNGTQHVSTVEFFTIVGVALTTGILMVLFLGAVGAHRAARIVVIAVGWICGMIAGLITAALLGLPPF